MPDEDLAQRKKLAQQAQQELAAELKRQQAEEAIEKYNQQREQAFAEYQQQQAHKEEQFRQTKSLPQKVADKVEQGGRVVEDTGKVVKHAAQAAEQTAKVGKAVGKTEQAIGQAATPIGGAAGEATGTVVGGALGGLGGGIVGGVAGAFAGGVGAIPGAAEGASQGASGGARIGGRAGRVAGEAPGKALEGLGKLTEKTSDVAEKTAQGVKKAAQGVEDFGKNIRSRASPVLGDKGLKMPMGPSGGLPMGSPGGLPMGPGGLGGGGMLGKKDDSKIASSVKAVLNSERAKEAMKNIPGAAGAKKLAEEVQEVAQTIKKVLNIVKGGSALSLVGIIVAFFLANAQLIFGNLFRIKIFSLNKYEAGATIFLDLFIIFLLCIPLVVMIVVLDEGGPIQQVMQTIGTSGGPMGQMGHAIGSLTTPQVQSPGTTPYIPQLLSCQSDADCPSGHRCVSNKCL